MKKKTFKSQKEEINTYKCATFFTQSPAQLLESACLPSGETLNPDLLQIVRPASVIFAYNTENTSKHMNAPNWNNKQFQYLIITAVLDDDRS